MKELMQFARNTLLVYLTCLPLSCPSFAGETSTWNSSLVFSVGQSTSNKACTSPWLTGVNGLTCTESDTAYRLAYVYHFSRNWGLEISGGDFGHAKAHATLNPAPAPLVAPATYNWYLHATGLAIAGVGTFHLGESISLFGKAGIVRARVAEEVNALDATGTSYYGASLNGTETTNTYMYNFTVGAGIQYNFNRDFAVRAQYENFGSYDIYSAYNLGVDDKVNISQVSAGLVVNF